MGEITIITASAGSGKTHRLARELETALGSGSARPECIIATTFTNKAAAELEERARQHLIHAGHAALAHRLAAARIGTVNSVCGRLVSEFAFELGQAPDLHVLDDELASQALRRAISAAMTSEVEVELSALHSRMTHFEWERFIPEVMQRVRTNGLGPDDLDACATKSWRGIESLFGDPVSDGAVLEQGLLEALDTFIQAVEAGSDTTKATRVEALTRARKAAERLRRKHDLPWFEWASLASLKVGKASAHLVAPVHAAAAQHDRHPRLRADVQRAIVLVFAVCKRALEQYAEFKRRWGVIDFVDQEVLALEALRHPRVRDELVGEVDLVLVDEFQDTSPLQLAIFLELAQIADRSVWVGDQKQAIFGFRGTDPALMEAALTSLSEGTEPELIDQAVETVLKTQRSELLPHSWRSRPGLVDLTSDLFAAAFAPHGIPEERVRLTVAPERTREPPGLGTVLEVWPLQIPEKNKTRQLALPVAAGVWDMLTRREPPVRVRNRNTGEARAVAPGDIAVLCRTNDECARVAAALEALDVRADVPRIGLCDTPEAVVMLAGLRVWLDPCERLARAEIARLLEYPDDPETWLASVFDENGELASSPALATLLEARRQAADAGALEAFDATASALQIMNVCARWGDTQVRRANVEALRSHAVRYVNRARASGLSPTLVGLLAYYELLRTDAWDKPRADSQAVRGEGDAVTVMTWHRAKGLEWPVVVLFGLEKKFVPELPTKVTAVAPAQELDLQEPLAGRWVRFWPTPYFGVQNGTAFKARLNAHPETERVARQSIKEALRVLYVGWTRARDRLVLAGQEGKVLDGVKQLLVGREGQALVSAPDTSGAVSWAGHTFELEVWPQVPIAPKPHTSSPGEVYLRAVGEEPPIASARLSSWCERGRVGDVHSIGPGLEVNGADDLHRVGEVVLKFLGAEGLGGSPEERLQRAWRLIGGYRVGPGLRPEALLRMADDLRAWVEATYPGARWRRDWPVHQRLESGALLAGNVGLVLEIPKGLVVIQHQVVEGTREKAIEHADACAGQLQAINRALEVAQEHQVVGAFVHLPRQGVLVQILPAAVAPPGLEVARDVQLVLPGIVEEETSL